MYTTVLTNGVEMPLLGLGVFQTNHAADGERLTSVIASRRAETLAKKICRFRQAPIRDLVMDLAYGLHKYRLRYRPWHDATRELR